MPQTTGAFSAPIPSSRSRCAADLDPGGGSVWMAGEPSRPAKTDENPGSRHQSDTRQQARVQQTREGEAQDRRNDPQQDLLS